MDKDKLYEELRKLSDELEELRKKEDPATEDVTKINELCDRIEEIDAEIKAGERAEKLTTSLNERTTNPVLPGDPNTGIEKGFGFDSDDNEEIKDRKFGEYLQAVARAALPYGQYIAGQECGRIDNRLVYSQEELRSTGLESATPSLGGFLVQTDFATGLITKVHETSILWNRIRQIPISSNASGLKLPGIDETSRAHGSRWGGIRAYWLEQGGTKTASKPKFLMLELSLKKLIGLCYAVDELLEDAAALGTIVREGFTEEFGFLLDDSILNGTGSGQPLGILNAGCLVSQAKEAGQAAATLVWENIAKMYARLWSRSRPNMIWLINQDCLPQLMNMSMPVGTGGVPVWLPAGAASGKPYDVLLGRPIIVVEQCQTLGTKGDIYLADLSQYIAIKKGGLQTASSIHVQFSTDETAFRFVMRVDGQPLWNNALTPYKGSSNTQSPFIVLNDRS